MRVARRSRRAETEGPRDERFSSTRAREGARGVDERRERGEFDASVIRIGAESRSIDARESAEERRASARERWRDVRAFRASVGETR